jgi:hypothetical protein
MADYENAVFISYAWGGESEEIANQIDRSLQARGIKIVRDKRDLGYKGMIRSFMERIGQGNAVIVIISDKYLRSKNCMYELVEIAENKEFLDRVFPIMLPDALIYDAVDRLGYVEYWQEQKGKLNERILKLSDVSNLQGIREELDDYDRFRSQISGLTSILKDMNALTPAMHQQSDFDELTTAIEKRMKEAPAASSSSPGAGSAAAQNPAPSQNVSASDNSTAVGNIQIGGGVNGNIVIGNNNQVGYKKK